MSHLAHRVTDMTEQNPRPATDPDDGSPEFPPFLHDIIDSWSAMTTDPPGARGRFEAVFTEILRVTNVPMDHLKDHIETVGPLGLEALVTTSGELEAEGVSIGLARGRTEGRAETLLELLEQRFGSVDDTTRARVKSAEAAQLQNWTARLLTPPPARGPSDHTSTADLAALLDRLLPDAMEVAKDPDNHRFLQATFTYIISVRSVPLDLLSDFAEKVGPPARAALAASLAEFEDRGLAMGLARGRIEGRAWSVLELLEAKFGPP